MLGKSFWIIKLFIYHLLTIGASGSEGGLIVPRFWQVQGVRVRGSVFLALIVLTPVKSLAGRHGDWCCHCHSSACWSSSLPPAAVAACSSAT